MAKVLILAIDGGGIKGIIPATFLQYIEQQTGKSCYQLFDIIGGTSTGGIISTTLTTINPQTDVPYTAAEILEFYCNENDAKQIFDGQSDGILEAKYKSSGVESFLQSKLGNTETLSSSYKKIVITLQSKVKQMFTTSYIVNSNGNEQSNPIQGQDYGPYLFNWYDAINSNNGINDYYVWEAARSSSAAPTYFPIAQVGGGQNGRSQASTKWTVDGGTMSNNSAMWAISEAFRTGIATKLEDIILISLGTGVYKGSAGVITTNQGGWSICLGEIPDNGNWGTCPWIMSDLYDLEKNESRGTILNVVLNAVQFVTNQQIAAFQKAGLTYFRLEPEDLTFAQSQMDNINSENISSLQTVANNYISANNQLFQKITSILNQ